LLELSGRVEGIPDRTLTTHEGEGFAPSPACAMREQGARR
jgi:hypothetical protein